MKTLISDPQNLIGTGTQVALVNLAPNAIATADEFDKAVASSNFLPRIQLFGANSNAVKEDKIGKGCFGLVRGKDEIEDLTLTFNCLPLDWRWKAMQVAEGNVVSVYDYDSDAFQKLKHTADNVKDSGCMWGVEFLVWLPDQKLYATFYLSSATARREAKPLRAQIGCATTLNREFIKKPKYSWYGPKVSVCSVPMTPPDLAEINEQIAAFRKTSTPSKVKASEGDESGREQ